MDPKKPETRGLVQDLPLTPFGRVNDTSSIASKEASFRDLSLKVDKVLSITFES
jgi:hypothetical protein